MAGSASVAEAPLVAPADEALAALSDADLEALTELAPEPEPVAVPAEPKKPAEPVAAAPPEPTPTPAPEKKKGDVRAALREERADHRRTKQRLNLFEQIERERAEAAAKMTPTAPKPSAITVRDAALDKITTAKAEADDLIQKIQTAEAEGKPIGGQLAREAMQKAEALARQAATESQRLVQEAVNATAAALRKEVRDSQEFELVEDLTEQGINYLETLRLAGVVDALALDAHGQWRDQILGSKVFSSVNPAKRAWKYAVDKLKSQGKAPVRLHGFEDESDETPAPEPAPTPAPTAPAPAAAPTLEAARQQGAREAVETIARHSQQPRGVRALPNAGAPAAIGWNAATWDRLNAFMDRNPDGFVDLMKKNRDLDRWFMGGRPA